MATWHVHASGCLFLSRSVCWRSARFRSAPIRFHEPSHSEECRAIWFLVWWLSSTVGYVPNNEVQLSLNDYATAKADQVLAAQPVFIRALTASLSASTRGVNSNNSRLPLLSDGASPLRPPLPSLVASPLSFATGCVLYALTRHKSRRKYFKYSTH